MDYERNEEIREQYYWKVVTEHYKKETHELVKILEDKYGVTASRARLGAYRDEIRRKIGYKPYSEGEGWANNTMFDDQKWQDPSPKRVTDYHCYDYLVAKRRKEIERGNALPNYQVLD